MSNYMVKLHDNLTFSCTFLTTDFTDYADLAMWWDLILITVTKVAISYVK